MLPGYRPLQPNLARFTRSVLRNSSLIELVCEDRHRSCFWSFTACAAYRWTLHADRSPHAQSHTRAKAKELCKRHWVTALFTSTSRSRNSVSSLNRRFLPPRRNSRLCIGFEPRPHPCCRPHVHAKMAADCWDLYGWVTAC